jgi:hypothetical protein
MISHWRTEFYLRQMFVVWFCRLLIDSKVIVVYLKPIKMGLIVVVIGSTVVYVIQFGGIRIVVSSS